MHLPTKDHATIIQTLEFFFPIAAATTIEKCSCCTIEHTLPGNRISNITEPCRIAETLTPVGLLGI